MRQRHRLWLGLLLLTVVAALGLGLAGAGWREAAVTPPLAGASAARDSRAVAAPVSASGAHAAVMPLAVADADAATLALMQRISADWCGFGAAERDRATEAARDAAEASPGAGADAMARLADSPASRVLAQASEQVRQRWVALLSQQADPRAQALADLLVTRGDDAEADAAARARLQARARSSADPMLTALALQRPCRDGACANVEAAQWARLEPANLQAWLALWGSPGDESSRNAYVLDRLATEARYSRSYAREAHQLLASLPQATALGLQSEAELNLQGSVVFGWPLQRMSPLVQACRAPSVQAGTAGRCEAAARLLFEQEDLLHRAMAMAIARSLVAVQPSLRPRWEAPARALEAAQVWSATEAERMAEAASAAGATSACAWQTGHRDVMASQLQLGEWGRLQSAMREAGVDEAALSARFRQEHRRSVLDAPPAPASAAGR
ncbi:hypothetical protein NYO99_02740 [Pelomonas sp. UHG3]|uniref:Uncharacterized protein n=1 Tax=Roseateles hydrophilus TaxID=2975054 RepID=A0ACC6C624_9BURK|nr:hypothetical protein [Pelomonas sp. UHG3]MCY4743883.1 hypothetical protein [Pelomonas sp. UHG3]